MITKTKFIANYHFKKFLDSINYESKLGWEPVSSFQLIEGEYVQQFITNIDIFVCAVNSSYKSMPKETFDKYFKIFKDRGEYYISFHDIVCKIKTKRDYIDISNVSFYSLSSTIFTLQFDGDHLSTMDLLILGIV